MKCMDVLCRPFISPNLPIWRRALIISYNSTGWNLLIFLTHLRFKLPHPLTINVSKKKLPIWEKKKYESLYLCVVYRMAWSNGQRSFSIQIIKLNDPCKIHGKQRIWWSRRGMKWEEGGEGDFKYIIIKWNWWMEK